MKPIEMFQLNCDCNGLNFYLFENSKNLRNIKFSKFFAVTVKCKIESADNT